MDLVGNCSLQKEIETYRNYNNNDLKWVKFPHKITDVDERTNKELLEHFSGERTGFVQVGDKKWFFPSGYKKDAEIYFNFEPRPDDVWIMTFPRSGTTWTQELIWLLANDLDYETAAEIPLVQRFPFFEFSTFVHPEVKEELKNFNADSPERLALLEEAVAPAWKYFSETSQRRFIKTHFPFELLPQNLLQVGCKVIYVARSPKDVAVSFYHLNQLFRTQGYSGDFNRYWDYFQRGLQPWTPYWEHLEQGWTRRNESNLLFLFYEDICRDLKSCISRMSHFLEKSYSDEQLSRLSDHLRIDNFRKNPSVNASSLRDLGITVDSREGFVRTGKSGGWRDYFVGDLNERANKWIMENLKKTDLKFPDNAVVL